MKISLCNICVENQSCLFERWKQSIDLLGFTISKFRSWSLFSIDCDCVNNLFAQNKKNQVNRTVVFICQKGNIDVGCHVRYTISPHAITQIWTYIIFTLEIFYDFCITTKKFIFFSFNSNIIIHFDVYLSIWMISN